jgi:hypothetical protein
LTSITANPATCFDRDTAFYIIPKKDVTLNVSHKWKDTMREFVADLRILQKGEF